MDIKELLATTPQDLAIKQKEALVSYVSKELRNIATLIEAGKYEKVYDEYVEFSPAGDGYGEDNNYISFEIGDIGDVLDKLKALSSD